MQRFVALSILLVASASCTSSKVGSIADGGTADTTAVADAAPGDGSQRDAPVFTTDANAVDCGAFTGISTPTCSGDGTTLGSCPNGVPTINVCPYGCLHGVPADAASSCLVADASNFSCTGCYGTTPVNDGNYCMTSFGCFIDPDGGVETDPDDNCIPSCLSEARTAGLCDASSTEPE